MRLQLKLPHTLTVNYKPVRVYREFIDTADSLAIKLPDYAWELFKNGQANTILSYDDSKKIVKSVNNKCLTEDYRVPLINITTKEVSPIELLFNYTLYLSVALLNYQYNFMETYLDFGLFPMFFLNKDLKNAELAASKFLEKIGLRYFKRRAEYYGISITVPYHNDIYVSRIDIADLLNCSPEKVDIKTLHNTTVKLFIKLYKEGDAHDTFGNV